MIGRFISADDIDILSIDQENLLQYNLYTYCHNNSVIYLDESGTFALSAFLVSATAGAAVNLATTFIAAQITGQGYTWKDATAAMSSGAVNAVPMAGPLLSGLISGVYAGYQSYHNDASLGQAIFCGLCTTGGISNLASWNKTALTVLEAGAIDFVFSTGLNSMAAATYKSVTYNTEKNNTAKSIGQPQQTGNTIKKSSGKSKCSVISKGCSADYFRYLYNGGKPF